MKKLIPTFTELKKSLNEALFNPKKQSPISVIIEDADPSYLESRAMELVREARFALGIGNKPNDLQIQQYQEKITKSIALLNLAKVMRSKRE